MAECERRVVKPCLERTAAECLETDGCAVSDDGLTCGEKTCYHGSEQSCRSDVNDCVWVGGPLGCEKRKCSHKTEEACSANATCSWVVAGVAGEGAATFAKFTEVGLFPDHQCTASLCADASCSTVLPSTESLVVKITEGYQQGKDTLFCRLCLSLGIQASWDAPSSTLSLSTVNGLAVLSYSQALANVSFSTVSDDDTVRDFAWSFVGDKCATGKGSAEVVAASCQVKRCQYDAQPLCNSDPYCQWNVTTCSQKLCTHINSELTCGRQEECHWSVDSSEGMCMQRACAKFKDSMDMCKSNSGCMWDDTKTVKCIETDCKVMESCRCQQDSDCFWRASEGACVAVDFALCPLMDVVFAFSGASAFGVPYGKHPHGFYAVVEMLRDWVGQAPLTTEKASIGAQSVETSGVRVALIQFAGKRTANLVVGSVATAPGSSGAGGQLSGDLGEVAGDLNWHEANYKGQDRFVSRALTTAAMTFNMDSPKDGRKKVVIVIADGALDDESVADARASLDALGVQTFVVLVHRFSSETPEDTQATKALAQLASSDNHFASVPLNELSGTVLNSLCDPTSTWGSLLLNATAISTDGNHKPCAFYSEQSTCTTDTACAWSTGYSVCLPSRCTSNCEKTTCTDECEWDDTLARCLAYVPETRLKCVSAVEEVCLSDSDCLYDVASGICATRACYHEDEEGCIADATGCGWSTVNQTCSAKQCAAGDRESCVAESMCEWEETCGAGCIVKPCAHAGESTCAGDPQCEWLNGECAVLPCAGYANEKCCDQFDDCQWDVRTSPAVCAVRPCVTAAGKDACDAESGCMWFGAPEKCVEKSCDLLGTDDKCACNADTDCYFVSAATGAHCTLQQYGSCPTMDIVMLLDGGASMSTVFGRHPVGFYGLIEIIRQWAKHLPLSKDTADVTAPLADTQTTRLSFVQFAGSSEWDAGDSRQILTPGITDPGTSGGRLTGSLSEINTDLTFHSDNPLAQGSGKAKKYLSAALDKAGKMLGTSPVDGRKKVVIVLVNGELDDASEYRGYKTVLNALQAEVFGAALSRAGTDAGAVSDLNNYVVSEPKEGRARSVTLDTLGEVLSSLCDPMDAWGQYLVDESTSCAQATLRKTCLKNGGCTWSDQLLTCESSPCIAHCDELACEADTTNNCAGGWNSTTHTCHRVVNCHYTEEPRCSDDFDCQWSDGQCAERPCAHSTEDGCSSDAAAGCEWTLNATCVVRACVTIDNQVSCEADSAEHNCVWSSVTGQCLVEQCGYIGKEACTADDLCSWGAEGCAFKLCTMYADDFECSSHPRCSWDVSAPPGMCRVTTCGTHDSEAECGHYNTSCMWSTGGNETADGACVKKGCQDVGSACECASNAECFWSAGDGYDCQAAAFGQCPAMDVLFAVDGSQNMASSFGRHPNGFAAVLEFVMDWTMQAPLTGGKPSKGVRVAMFQFSTGVTTGDNGGKLSGDAALIAKNVAWHAGSMNGGSSVAAGSALATALGLFKTEATAKGRVQVAVLITSQAVGDSGDLSSVQAQLEQARVITVGIALRRFSTVQDQDEKNTKTLALVAGSTDRVVSLVADDVLEQFMDLCKPSTKWGALVASRQTEQIAPFAAKSCAQLFKPADCTKDLACEWSYGTSTCTAAGCSMHCDDESCGADDACAWEGAEAICQKVTPCGYSQQAACEADDLCNWVASDETCAVDESPCAYPSERACSGDYDCEWTDGACSSFQPCDERAKEDCEESKNSKRGRCEWSIRDGKCGVNSVRGECDEGCCTCLTGWGGRECSVCDFDVANDGSCTVCDKDTTCSTHGECATSGICLCDPGWTGIDCSEHVCEPAGAHWYTAFPNSPVSGETFTLIVHGCFPDNSSFHSVRLVQGNSSCDVEPEDRCQTSRGTLSMSRSKCDDVSQRDSAKLEPTAQQEILVDVRAYTADKSEYTVCWNHPSEGWRRLATHTRNGNRAGTLKVSAQQNGDTGAAAASTIEEDGSPCCEGLSLGSACVPQGAAVAFYVLTLALVLGVGIMVLKSKSELNTLAAIKAGDESVYTYEEFDMEEQSNLGASTRLEASLISNEITSLGGSMLRSTPSGVASSIVPDVRL
ncbi:hypothetical protein DIPPA_19619 [Diplonema papillatum]|nr:hypothetical protein DIPPA_19619 [Diplonema papillatum]